MNETYVAVQQQLDVSKLTVLEQESRQFFVSVLAHDVQDGRTVLVLLEITTTSTHGQTATNSPHGSSGEGK